MIPRERRQAILDLLGKKGYMSVQNLADHLFVSPPTLRRDLSLLAKEGAVRRTHGGAVLVASQHSLTPIRYRSRIGMEEKKKIGRIASTLISEGDSVFLDSGSTCLNLVYAIKDIPDLYILTNGLYNVLEMSQQNYENVLVEIPGGNYDMKHACIVGAETEEYISRRHARISFVSCSGINDRAGLTVVYEKDISIKKEFLRNSDMRVMLMDSHKFGLTKYYQVCTFGDFDILICDKRPPDLIIKACDESNTEIMWE